MMCDVNERILSNDKKLSNNIKHSPRYHNGKLSYLLIALNSCSTNTFAMIAVTSEMIRKKEENSIYLHMYNYNAKE